MRIGIFGGTFSPVHNGHIAAAHAFMEKMWLDVLYVMPTALPPHKQLHGDAAAADRLEMLRMPDTMAYPISFGYAKRAYPWSVPADFIRIARAQYPQPA